VTTKPGPPLMRRLAGRGTRAGGGVGLGAAGGRIGAFGAGLGFGEEAQDARSRANAPRLDI
jgi:hypothetical protein